MIMRQEKKHYVKNIFKSSKIFFKMIMRQEKKLAPRATFEKQPPRKIALCYSERNPMPIHFGNYYQSEIRA